MLSRDFQNAAKIASINLSEAGHSFSISCPLLALQGAPSIAGDEVLLKVIITQHATDDVRRFALAVAPRMAAEAEGNCHPEGHGMDRCLGECRSGHLA